MKCFWFGFLESNAVHQKKSENSKTKRDAPPAIEQPVPMKTVEDTAAVVKRSVKTSGIEDNDGGDAAKN